MQKYNLYWGVASEQFNLHSVTEVEFEKTHDAKLEARAYAEDYYMQNPERDILEIMREEKVEEFEAKLLFNNEMLRNTVYHIEEIVEVNGEVIEVIRHDFK